MRARFDDLVTGRGLVCPEPSEVVVARAAEEVVPALERLDRLCRNGSWAWGYIAYEAARAFGLATRDPDPALPLLWFGVGAEPVAAPVVVPAGRVWTWTADWSAADHAARVAAIRDEIARGETYQANLTTRFRAAVDDPAALYADLVHATGGAYGCLLDTGEVAVSCASPELFVQRDGDAVTMRPMKGTARRGVDLADDELVRARLRSSPKERAENVMIVDLVRNDLSVVADDVRAVEVGRAERYPAVWQLVSDVTGRLRTGSLVDLLRATFPCGSVTGAPKAATMRILADLEDAPRGAYCGAVGLLGPSSARLVVGIRTAVVRDGVATYGAGGGITWSSDPAAEWAEVAAKAPQAATPRRLLETMRYVAGAGVRHVDRHLARLAASASYLGIPCDTGDLAARLARLDDAEDRRVRLLLAADGTVEVEVHDLGETGTALALDDVPVDSGDRWLRHKTDRREVYDDALARHPEADDVVLVNERGLVTETARANLLVLRDGVWVTPPVSDGLLPGVGRAVLLDAGEVVERSVTIAECLAAQGIATVSALRGRRPASLTRTPPTSPATRSPRRRSAG